MNTCFFIGHQDAPQSVMPQLLDTLEYLVTQCRVTDFIVGHYGDFDRMAVSAVQQMIQKYPEKELLAEMLDPYALSRNYGPLPHYFDNFYYPEGLETVPRRYCIEKANQLALDQADYLVAFITRDSGNAAKLLRRARRITKYGRLTVLNLGEKDSF